jgi:hypothetical protein
MFGFPDEKDYIAERRERKSSAASFNKEDIDYIAERKKQKANKLSRQPNIYKDSCTKLKIEDDDDFKMWCEGN